jgi:hypothetical protein
MGLFFWQSHARCLAGLWTACGKITVSGIPNRLSYGVTIVLYTQFTNVAMGHVKQPGGPGYETHGIFSKWLYLDVYSNMICPIEYVSIRKLQFYDTGYFHNGSAEDPNLLECYIVQIGK